jgi:hypothetical protein
VARDQTVGSGQQSFARDVAGLRPARKHVGHAGRIVATQGKNEGQELMPSARADKADRSQVQKRKTILIMFALRGQAHQIAGVRIGMKTAVEGGALAADSIPTRANCRQRQDAKPPGSQELAGLQEGIRMLSG